MIILNLIKTAFYAVMLIVDCAVSKATCTSKVNVNKIQEKNKRLFGLTVL